MKTHTTLLRFGAMLGACALVLTSCEKKPDLPSLEGSGGRKIRPVGTSPVAALAQNWTDQTANLFYNLPQGSKMLTYQWFLNLEQAGTTDLFRTETNFRSLGYITRDPDPKGNPDGLPIGFVKDGDHLGLTCAACHTGMVTHEGKAWVVDGAPALADAASLLRGLAEAMQKTHEDEPKFGRFAKAVLGASAAADGVAKLKADLGDETKRMNDYYSRNFPHGAQAPAGPGRLDAFDAIFNEVSVRFAQNPSAQTQCDAPVSYPFLWDTPQHDFVQWNGSAPNIELPVPIRGTKKIGALGRNIGEVLGVFANVETSQPEVPLRGYTSTVIIPNLIQLEETLTNLWSPEWPAELGKIDPDLKTKGQALYQKHCVSCHALINRKDPTRRVIADMRNVGTDESMARNAAQRTTSSGVFQGRLMLPPDVHVIGATEPVAQLLEHVGQRVILGEQIPDPGQQYPLSFMIHTELSDVESNLKLNLMASVQEHFQKVIPDLKLHPPTLSKDGGIPKELKQIEDFAQGAGKVAEVLKTVTEEGAKLTMDRTALAAPPTETFKYKARPLNGIWATAPYLHNGSVPNLDELLKPAAQRNPTFKVGSREFDPVLVGFRTDQGNFTFDVNAQPGNSNAGHEYGQTVLTDDERKALVEYMKSL